MTGKQAIADAAGTKNLLVILPNWIGDVVLATPALRALREAHAEAHIAYLMRPYVREALEPCAWCDEMLFWSAAPSRARRQHDFVRLSRELRRRRFDVAALLSNAFRAALLARLARIPHIVGYGRDGRSLLLTVRMMPDRVAGKFVPVSMVRYYGAMGRYLGGKVDEDRLELAVREQDIHAADALLAGCGIGPGERFAAINPGAAYGSAKCWPAERFAQVAERIARRIHLPSVVVYGPGEVQIAQGIARLAPPDAAIVLPQPVGLGVLKAILRRCEVLITNDTGPRHLAKALGRPVVTIFGPTDPRWTETRYPLERKVMVSVPCGPCMLKRCPLDHRCMQLVTADLVCQAVAELLGPSNSVPSFEWNHGGTETRRQNA